MCIVINGMVYKLGPFIIPPVFTITYEQQLVDTDKPI